ncbi:UPF0755 protein [Bacillus pakistanensis]|uniref:Endolytic murein transglycosylase n=1 Tax=Rossellomorea pakistanensis TaxID=992288 RepID=A0ABS2NAJ7_9BACI|nr:endolytic transglycosylase MltG [Bacillus pakistanensis]MBM7584779.1 UPF0755 protein [Bacillus pakistanensis]
MNKNQQPKKEALYHKLLERQEEAKVIRKIVGIVALVLVLLIGGTALGGYFYVKSALKPVDPKDNKPVKVEIPIGSGVTSIGNILEESGIIKNSLVFKYFVKFNNESGFQAGAYDLTPSMTLNEIVTSLKSGKVMKDAEFTITVPEGYQLNQIADEIAKETPFKSKDIMEKLNNKEYLEQLSKKYPKLITKDLINNKKIKYPLEGYLYPATYPFYEKEPSLEEILDGMISQTNDVLAQFNASMMEKEMDSHKLLTFASLVEEEATKKADRGRIASVFYNRLEKEMPLQTDPTVLYALGKHKSRTVYDDLDVESPYNTYKVKGLPPGPIANAGITSIKAVLEPDHSEYLYFLASKDGTVHYSETLEEHNKKKAKYITNEKE